MCKLVSIQNSNGINIMVADIKADVIKKIIDLAKMCKHIDYIYIFGSAVEERCKEQSDIDIAIVSNITKSKLYNTKDYKNFTDKLYSIDIEQEYDILQFNSMKDIEESRDFVCKDIINKGKLLYSREGI